MKVIYIRDGFANNSSSSHSIVYKNPDGKYNDRYDDDDRDGGVYFGWDNFVLASKAAKKKYFDAMFDRRVDHQSVIAVPNNIHTGKIDSDIKKAFKELLMRDDVVVFGGNDNDDSMELGDGEECIRLKLPSESADGWVSRKEPYGFVLFNKETGAKIRMSNTLEEPENTLPEVPELVDLNITDCCYSNCDFCYRRCTAKGQHASLENIKKSIDYMSNVGVFECVLGGGDIFLHPKINEIFEYLKSKKMNYAYTTNTYYIYNQKEIIESGISSIAFSIDGKKDIPRLLQDITALKSISKFLDKKIQLSLQFIDGILPIREVMKTIEIFRKYYHNSNIGFSFVGFKQSGRATEMEVKRYTRSDIQKILNKTYRMHADTTFIHDHPEIAKNNYVDRCEGTHSCFIDAVTNRVYRSSFQLDKSWEFDPKNMKNIFAEIQKMGDVK